MNTVDVRDVVKDDLPLVGGSSAGMPGYDRNIRRCRNLEPSRRTGSNFRKAIRQIQDKSRLTSGADIFERENVAQVVFARTGSIADVIERHLRTTRTSVEAALYRFNSQRLASVLYSVHKSGIDVRLIVDYTKYEDSLSTQRLLSKGLPFRLSRGRDGSGSKMHHKFIILDGTLVMTGSYNWTFASEEKNFENLLVLQETGLIKGYREEFDALWASAERP